MNTLEILGLTFIFVLGFTIGAIAVHAELRTGRPFYKALVGVAILVALVLWARDVRASDRPACDRYVTGSEARTRCVEARRDCRVYTTGSAAYARCNAADRPSHRRTRRAPDAPAERPHSGR